MKKAWVLSYPLSAQGRLWSDWADAQADLSLRLAQTHFVGFVISRLMYYQNVTNILCFWTDRSYQSSLIKVYTVCHSFYIFLDKLLSAKFKILRKLQHWFLVSQYLSCLKTDKMTVCPAKTQISLGIQADLDFWFGALTAGHFGHGQLPLPHCS